MSELLADDPRRDLWRSGRYEIVGDWFRDASTAVLRGLPLEGVRLLDLATGSGEVAIEAARRGAHVVGVDLTPELLDVARTRAAAAEIDIAVDVEWVHDDFDLFVARPECAGAFDVVTSSFGVMFAPDSAATARAMAAVTAPGGTIAVCAWAATGLFGVQRSDELTALMPPLPPGALGRPWSSFSGVAGLFAGSPVTLIGQRRHPIGLEFASVEDAIDQLEQWSGPWQQLFAHFHENGTLDAARALLVVDFSQHMVPVAERPSTGVALRADYVVSVLRRHASSEG